MPAPYPITAFKFFREGWKVALSKLSKVVLGEWRGPEKSGYFGRIG